MDKFLEKYENIPLSNTRISQLLDHNVKIEVYPNLHKYNNIDELLGTYGACVLLFESMPKYGHWCCIFKVSDELIEFFNPYGTIAEGWPDDCLTHIPEEFRKITNQLIPKLSLLMLNSPYELSYNEYPFQKHESDIKTCGRHCVVRLRNKHMELEEYLDYLNFECDKYNINYDKLVTLLTL
jgi:hypothetical protein